jgi:hypothetical protein
MAIPQVDFAPDKEGKKVPVLDEFPPPHERGPGDGIIDQNRVFHAVSSRGTPLNADGTTPH